MISDSNGNQKTGRLAVLKLRGKMKSFPKNKFIIWTGTTLTQGATNEESAKRTRTFFDWVKNEWNVKTGNIYIWDFYGLETESGYYLRNEYATSLTDPHPNNMFSKKVAPYFCQRIVDIIEDRGVSSSMTGK